MIMRYLPLAVLLAATAACAPVPSATTDVPATQSTAPYQPDFLLMTERSPPEQREAARGALLAEFARIGIAPLGRS